MPLRNSALTAMPISKRPVVDSLLAVVVADTRNTKAVAAAPPRQAAIGSVHSPAWNFSAAPSTKYNDAPNAAPLEVPTNPGSTIGFRNNACINTPPIARLAPTKRQASVRGKRISRKIRSVRLSSSGALHPFLSAEIMSANDTPTAPKRTEKTAITASAIASTGRIPAYGLPSGFAGMNQVLELQHVFTGARTDIHQVVFLDAKDSPILGCTGAVHAGQSRHLFGRAEPVIAEIGQQNHVRVRRGDDLRRELHHSSISADRNFPARPFNHFSRSARPGDRQVDVHRPAEVDQDHLRFGRVGLGSARGLFHVLIELAVQALRFCFLMEKAPHLAHQRLGGLDVLALRLDDLQRDV